MSGERAPVEPAALRSSIADIEAFLAGDTPLCDVENPVGLVESIMLAMHEMKRLQAELPKLRALVGSYAINDEFDFPADVPEFCGFWCNQCKNDISLGGEGHSTRCACFGVAPDTAQARKERARSLPKEPVEVALKGGWLKRDTGKAAARVAQLSCPPSHSPADWKLVPVEPSEAMMDAAIATVEKPCFPQDIYAAMLAAAPASPAPAGWKLVPFDPTPEMLRANAGSSDCHKETWNRAMWGAFLAAAPVAFADGPTLPADATPAMVAAALQVDWSNEDEEATVHNVWHAMLAAAAASPQPEPCSALEGGR